MKINEVIDSDFRMADPRVSAELLQSPEIDGKNLVSHYYDFYDEVKETSGDFKVLASVIYDPNLLSVYLADLKIALRDWPNKHNFTLLMDILESLIVYFSKRN